MAKISWDDPFGNNTLINPITGELIWARRTETGVLVPRNMADLDSIRADQAKIAFQFRQLKRAGEQVLQRTHSYIADAMRVSAVVKITYRVPDPPHPLSEFTHVNDAHVVALETSGKKLHPIVERVFPVRPFSELDTFVQNSLLDVTSIGTGKTKPPENVRFTSPQLAGDILNWIEKLEGTIYDYEFAIRPTANSISMVSPPTQHDKPKAPN